MELQLYFLEYNEPQLCVVKKVWAKKSQSLLNLFCRVKKGSFFHFKSYNLAIYVVKFFETFSTYYFNSPKQDPTVEFQKIKIKINLCNLHKKWQFWSVLFLKHNQRILGINWVNLQLWNSWGAHCIMWLICLQLVACFVSSDIMQ
jgi:hypothetical protein